MKQIWQHTGYVVLTLVLYFCVIQGPYDLWIRHVGYQFGSYLVNIIGITVLFWLLEVGYNWLRKSWQRK